MSIKSVLRAIPLTSIPGNTIDNTQWYPINPLGLPQACSLVFLINTSNASFEVSYNGIDAQDYIRAGSERILPVQTNAYQDRPMFLAKGTIVYLRGAAGNAQNIYLAAYYQ